MSLLTAGRAQEAMMVLQGALGIVKNAVNQHDEAISQGLPIVNDKSDLEKSDFAIRESSVALTTLESSQGYLYNRPLLLGEPGTDDLEGVLSLYSAVILFNLALTSHVMGHSNKENSFKRATVLYKMSIQLLMNCSTLGATPMVLALLALNNKANIHYDYCNYNQATSCLNEISRILQLSDYAYATLPESDIEGLLLNIMILERPSGAKAA